MTMRSEMLAVTRPVPASEYDNSGGRAFAEGERLYKYMGPTYGCVGDGQVAVSEGGPMVNPFFGFPKDAVRELPAQ